MQDGLHTNRKKKDMITKDEAKNAMDARRVRVVWEIDDGEKFISSDTIAHVLNTMVTNRDKCFITYNDNKLVVAELIE